MRKYTVLVTRDVTQSAVLTIEAADEETAESAALKAAKKQRNLSWETDDGSIHPGEEYVTDVEPIEASQ